MKKIIMLMVLATACSKNCLLSQIKGDGFLPAHVKPLQHSFKIHFRYQNQVIISLSSMKMLSALQHPDSILATAVKDIALLNDSAAQGVGSKKIEIVMSDHDVKRLRITRMPQAETYAIDSAGLAMLKIAQDSISLTRVYRQPNTANLNTPGDQWKMTIVVNNIEEINAEFMQLLDTVLHRITAEYAAKSGWTNAKDASLKVEANYYVTDSLAPVQSVYNKTRLLWDLSVFGEVRVQNYRQQFAPSFEFPAAGVAWRRNGRLTTLRLAPEAFFFFDTNAAGNIRTNTNVFLNLSFSRKATDGAKPLPAWSYSFRNTALGILLRREGNFLEKNTMKLQLGGLEYKTLRLSPQFFFNGWLKDMSPSLRVGIAF